MRLRRADGDIRPFHWRCVIRLEAYGHSDVGLKRAGNEDSYYCSAEEGLAIVADGMGGHASGEVASALAVKIIRDRVLAAFGAGACSSGEELCGVLDSAIREANDSIFEKGGAAVKTSRMGTTIAAFVFCGDSAAIAHVGDSRVYLLRDGVLHPLTQDHSLVNEQLRANLISAEEARTSIYRHIVTRALGMKKEVEPETQTVVLRPGDLVLLCSDGLFDMVEDEAIKNVLVEHGGDLKKAAHRLIDLANMNGGEDNITVVLISVKGEGRERGEEEEADKTTMLTIE